MKLLIRLDSLIHPRTGIGYYTEHLLRELYRSHPKVEIGGAWYHGRALRGDAIHTLLEEGEVREEASVPSGPIFGTGIVARLKPFLRSVPGVYRGRQAYLEWQASRKSRLPPADLYHEPNYIPLPYKGPNVLTVHDMSHVRFPQYHPQERVAFLDRCLPEAVKKASHIITVSEFARQELCEIHPEAEGKTTAVHNGVDDDFRPRDSAETAPTLEQWGLVHGSYILSVATLEPRKNLPALVRAYRALPTSLRRDVPLVLAGGKGWKNRELEQLVSGLDEARVILTGRVSKTDLVRLVSGAKLFAYPSFYEGFGLPVAEARASGVPVLTSDRGATKEIAGSDTFLVNPESDFSDELRAALEWSDSHIPEIHRFSWSDTAARTVDVYNRII
ncbi:glycosyltransferase family 4 protein [Gilvimarinus sp. F26214L]|uniref:glycosyltransferase family 4 protein n=1 Tax=Gilvimarinus sp. DZF01 TaxID=3461371 RepID=UPI004045C53B